MTMITCTQCGIEKDIIRRKYKTKSIKTPFCSTKCCRDWQRINLTKPIINENGIKQCGCCGEMKTRKEFNSKSKTGSLQSYCKRCLYLYQMRRWNQKKITAIEYKGGKCIKCGLIDHPVVYDFHHPNDDKDMDWSSLRNKKWETIVKEIDKCVLICAPCHRKEHLNTKLWPKWQKE